MYVCVGVIVSSCRARELCILVSAFTGPTVSSIFFSPSDNYEYERVASIIITSNTLWFPSSRRLMTFYVSEIMVGTVVNVKSPGATVAASNVIITIPVLFDFNIDESRRLRKLACFRILRNAVQARARRKNCLLFGAATTLPTQPEHCLWMILRNFVILFVVLRALRSRHFSYDWRITTNSVPLRNLSIILGGENI